MAIVFQNLTTAITGGTASSALTIAKPASTVQNDFLLTLLSSYRQGGAGAAVSPPTGFTEIFDVAHTNPPFNNPARYAVAWKIAGASEPADYTWNQTAINCFMTGAVLRFTGVDLTTPIDAHDRLDDQGISTSNSYTCPSVNASASGKMTLRLVMVTELGASAMSAVGPSEYTERLDLGNSPGQGTFLALYTKDTPQGSGATGTEVITVTSADEGNVGYGVTIVLAEVVSGQTINVAQVIETDLSQLLTGGPFQNWVKQPASAGSLWTPQS